MTGTGVHKRADIVVHHHQLVDARPPAIALCTTRASSSAVELHTAFDRCGGKAEVLEVGATRLVRLSAVLTEATHEALRKHGRDGRRADRRLDAEIPQAR